MHFLVLSTGVDCDGVSVDTIYAMRDTAQDLKSQNR